MKCDVVKADYEGVTFFYKKGTTVLHNEEGPAVIRSNGTEGWYLNGKFHREDGPAVDCASGYKVWYINGQRHREDGPAIVFPNGDKYWYLDDEEVTEKEFNERMGNRSEYKITTGALILGINGKELAFNSKEELVDYLTREM